MVYVCNGLECVHITGVNRENYRQKYFQIETAELSLYVYGSVVECIWMVIEDFICHWCDTRDLTTHGWSAGECVAGG